MRIAMFAWEAQYAIRIGGVAVYVSELAAALTRAGHAVHVFTRQGERQPLYDNIFGVHYHRAPWEPCARMLDEVARVAHGVRHYAQAAAQKFGAFDWLHAHDWLGFVAAEQFNEERDLPLAMTFHTTEWGRAEAWPEAGEAAAIADIERRATIAARAIMPVSHAVRRELDWLFQIPDWKTGIVYYGVNQNPFVAEPFAPGEVKKRFGIAPMAPMILFVGRLHPNKGADILLAALADVRETIADIQCVFVGTGSLQEQLQAESARLGLSDQAHFPGWVSGHDVVQLYRACDVVVCPSRKDPFGIVTLSAWAAGKPVIATKIGAPGEFIKPAVNGLVAPANPAAIATALRDLFADFDRLRWLGENGRTTVDTAFTWDAVAQNVLTLYDRHAPTGQDSISE